MNFNTITQRIARAFPAVAVSWLLPAIASPVVQQQVLQLSEPETTTIGLTSRNERRLARKYLHKGR